MGFSGDHHCTGFGRQFVIITLMRLPPSPLSKSLYTVGLHRIVCKQTEVNTINWILPQFNGRHCGSTCSQGEHSDSCVLETLHKPAHVRCEVLEKVHMQNHIFCDVTPYSLIQVSAGPGTRCASNQQTAVQLGTLYNVRKHNNCRNDLNLFGRGPGDTKC